MSTLSIKLHLLTEGLTLEKDSISLKLPLWLTRQLEIQSYIDGGIATTNQVSLLENAPENVNKGTTHKKGIEKELGGWFSFSNEDVAPFSESINWTNQHIMDYHLV